MNVRTMLRSTAVAAAVAVMVLGSPSGAALAAPKDTAADSCRKRGYAWDDKLGCADKKCEYNGKTYGALDMIKILTPNGYRDGFAYCNGFSGNWVVLGPSAPDPSRANPTWPLPSFEQAP